MSLAKVLALTAPPLELVANELISRVKIVQYHMTQRPRHYADINTMIKCEQALKVVNKSVRIKEWIH